MKRLGALDHQAQAVILLLVGGAILRSSISDQYLRYVRHGLRPYLIAAGTLLVVAAIMTLFYDVRGSTADHDLDDGHGHASGGPRIAWLLLLPVLGLLLIAPPALGSYSANRAGTALTQVSDFPPLPKGDPVRTTLLDYASRAVFDGGRSLDGRRVQLVGFVLRGPDGTRYLARMVLSCCAADARPVKVALAGAVPDGVAADAWLRVVGRYADRQARDAVNGERIPYLTVVSSEQIPTPAEQYET